MPAMKTKKIINDGTQVVDEMLDGMLAAHPHLLRRSTRHPRAIVGAGSAQPGKVGLVIGGGSGHEPTFAGLVGKGLADAAAVGDVFTSPTPDMVLACAEEANAGAGVLFMYGNYQGDVLNFDMAAELAEAGGITVRTVTITDDVASAPKAETPRRRGVAGGGLVYKVTGAACAKMLPLDECERIARKANAATATMGVALSPCSMPATRMPNFSIGEEEMEIGMGIHGELGISRGKLASADEMADAMLDRILADMVPERGARVAVLVNSLGATPIMELYILNRRVAWRLKDAGIVTHTTMVGNYCTSMDMAGASITLMQLDGELQGLLDAPCETPAIRR